MASIADLLQSQTQDQADSAERELSSNAAAVFNQRHNIDSSSASLSRATVAGYHRSVQSFDTLGNLISNSLDDNYDNSAYDARTKARGTRIADAAGFDEGANIIQNNFTEDLPANIVGTLTGGKAFEIGAEVGSLALEKIIKKSAKTLLTRKAESTLLDKATRELEKNVFEATPVVGLNMFNEGTIDKEGKVTNKAGIEDWGSFLTTLGGEAMLGAVPAIAGQRAFSYMKKRKIRKAQDAVLDKADNARLNLDEDAIRSINKDYIKDPKILKEGDTPDGFINVETFDKTLDDFISDKGAFGAFADHEGNFFIRTHNLGEIHGKLELSSTYTKDGAPIFEPIVDVKNSELKDLAKYSAYDGKPIVDVNGYQMDRIKSFLKTVEDEGTTTGNMSEFDTLKVDDNGKITVDPELLADYASKKGIDVNTAKSLIDNKLMNNKAFRALQDVGIKAYSGDTAIGAQDVKVNRNPLAQLFTASDYSIDKAGKFVAALGDGASDTARTVSAIATLLEDGLDITHTLDSIKLDRTVPKSKKSFAHRQAYDLLFNKVKTSDGYKYMDLKPEAKKALALSFVKNVLKSVDDEGNIKARNISGKAVVNGIFDSNIMDIKGAVPFENVKSELATLIDGVVKDIDLGKKTEAALDAKGERPSAMIPAKDNIVATAKELGDTAEARANTMSEAFGQFTRDWSKGIATPDVTLKVKDPYQLTRYNKDIMESAEREAEIVWHFTDDGKELLMGILEGKPIVTGNKVLDSALNGKSQKVRLAVISGAISKVDVTGKMTLDEMIEAYGKLPDHVKQNIDKSAQELITEAKDLLDTMKAFPDGHKYGTIIDNQKRVRYDALTNPKTSKLAMMVMEPKNASLHTLIDVNGKIDVGLVRQYKRGFLENFGKKPAKLSDAEIDDAFNKLVAEVSADAKSIIDEGIISFTSVKKLQEFTKLLNERKPNSKFRMTTEIDGVTNGPASMNAQLGVIDPSTGIGKELSGDDLYTRFNSVFTEITGIEFSRSDVKSIVTGDFYLADHYTSTAALAEVILSKIQFAQGSNNADMILSTFVPAFKKKFATISKYTGLPKRVKKYMEALKEYNALKDWLDGLAKGDIDVKQYKDVNAIRTEKQNRFKALEQEMESFKFDNDNKFNKQDIDFYFAIKRLMEGKELSPGQKAAFINSYTDMYVAKTEDALTKLYNDDRYMFEINGKKKSIILEYRELNSKITEYASFQTARALTDKTFIHKAEDPRKKITDLMQASNPELGVKAPQIEDILRWTEANKAEGISVVDVLEEMGRKGYLSDKVIAAASLQRVLPHVNLYSGSIPFYSFKGYAGYDAMTRTNFGSITIAGVHLPIQNITYDAAAMAHMVNTSDKPFLNKFDAIITDPVTAAEVAKEGNKYFAGILKNANPGEYMEAFVLDIQRLAKNMPGDTRAAAMFMAQQKMMASQGKAPGDRIGKLADTLHEKMRPTLNDGGIVELKERISSFKGAIEAEKKALPADAKVEQYTNGNKAVVSTLDEGVNVKQEIKEVDFNDFDHNFEYLKDVEKNDTPLGFLIDNKVKSGVATKNPVTGVKFDPNLDVPAKMTEDGIIVIRGTRSDNINDISLLETIYHEPGHNLITKFGDSYDEAVTMIEQLMTRNGWVFTDADGKAIGDALKGSVAADEYLVKVIGILKMNEAIINQPNKLAARFGKTNLHEDIRILHIDGHAVATVTDLEKVLRHYDFGGKVNIDKALTQLSAYEVDLAMSVNSSYSIRNLLLDKEYAAFSPTFKNTWKNLADRRDKIVDVNKRINTIPALELFKVDAEREVVEKILALKNGMQNSLQMHTASAVEDMAALIKEAGVDNFSKHLGRYELAGMSVTLDELKAASTLEEYKTLLGNTVRRLQKHFEEDMKLAGISQKELDNIVYRLATGQYNPTKTNHNKMAKQFLSKLYLNDQTKIHENMPMLTEYFKKKAAYVRMFPDKDFAKNKFNDIAGKAFTMFATNPEAKRVAIEAMTLNNRFSAKNELFNGNIEINPHNIGRKLILTSETEGIKPIAKVQTKDGIKYVIEANSEKYMMWNQDSQIINPELASAELPFYQVGKGKHQAFINAQNLLHGSESIDADFISAYKRNYYNKMKLETAMEMYNYQYQLMKQEGLLLTKAEHSKLIKENPDMAEDFKLLPKDNPVSRQSGQHYYNVRYRHYLEGTKGKDIAKVMNKFFGNKTAGGIATKLAKGFFGGTRIMKSLILQTRLSSYINSFLSSSAIFALHADNPLSYAVDVMNAKKLIGEYRGLISKYVKAQGDGDTKLAASLKAQIDKHELSYAFKHGIADTIRKDAGTTGTYGESEVFVELSKIFGKEAADRLKPLALDNSIKAVRKFGELYDATELYPKVALYLNVKAARSTDEAIQTVLMAFPTYNNLNPFLNVVDSFSPFTKYMANFPKMFMYTLDQHPYRLAPMHLAYLGLPSLTFNRDNPYEDQLASEGFIKIGDYAWYYESAYPLSLPSKSFGDSNMGALGTVANFDFLLTAPSSLGDLTPMFELKHQKSAE